ncbi:BURP domain protein USPL1-like [Pistacia vera]|uniref:BURP domain protein USPL1-like n=1 Tax=Pistacia vera TaxID=55513 RepID=UPI0012634B3D|nr:BURP domain protein USPL1-like [Pistacia vera]XP_031264161.1 BURP domain protein USPL1-like [Pistacia vera]XP_031267058.1 BURP domain protein USPL1-like [Pistacia vera]
MGSGFSSWCFTLCLLLAALMCAQDSNARRVTKGEGDDRNKYDPLSEASDGHDQWINGGHHAKTSHVDHMDPSVHIFFTIDNLKIGKSLPIYFSYKNSTKSYLLSREEANSIPFSSQKLPYLLELFSFSKDSPQAKAMEYTLEHCEREPIKGETRFCATSLESMLDSARGFFGLDTNFKILTTSSLTKLTPLQNYTILEVPQEIFAPKFIACHSLPYLYAVFYCHGQESKNRLFQISLGGENGEKVEAVAVCHMDTSLWDADHVSFRVLKIKPGDSPVCHFFPLDNLVWVPFPA